MNDSVADDHVIPLGDGASSDGSSMVSRRIRERVERAREQAAANTSTEVVRAESAPMKDSLDSADEIELLEDPVEAEQPVVRWVPAPRDPPRKVSTKPARVPWMTRFELFADRSKPHTILPVIEQLRERMPADRLLGWVVTLVITGIAFVIRWVNIGYPTRIMFDETYYAKDAREMR